MPVRITNREEPYQLLLQKQSDLCLCCVVLPFAGGQPLVDQWNYPLSFIQLSRDVEDGRLYILRFHRLLFPNDIVFSFSED